MIRLICIDVDGTLVGSSGDAHPEVWPAAQRARAAGIRLAVCTGRPGFGPTLAYARRLDPDGWHGFQNGASVLNPATGETRSEAISAESVAMLVARARGNGRTLELYGDADYAIENVTPLAERHAGLLGVPFDPKPLEALPGPIVRCQWLVPMGESAAVMAESHPGLEVSASTSPVMPDAEFVNMTRKGIDKGVAVRRIAAAHAIPLDEVMFVGDGDNDVPAMRIVGFPVAMANAERRAMAAARVQVAHVDEAGLVEAIALASGL